ncbi:MAG: hypothetical protein WKF71_10175 [Pyrinomonadaceae bacterium]
MAENQGRLQIMIELTQAQVAEDFIKVRDCASRLIICSVVILIHK